MDLSIGWQHVDTIAAFASLIAAGSAVLVAYVTVFRSSQPQILVHYRPNPDIPSIIDLVVENIGGGTALDVRFSAPIPISCYGIEKADREGKAIPESGFPVLSAGQQYVFDGGQYAGLDSALGAGLAVSVSYRYREPFGFSLKGRECLILRIEHLRWMPSRTSADNAIVDALKSHNRTTLHEIRDELRKLNRQLADVAKERRQDPPVG